VPPDALRGTPLSLFLRERKKRGLPGSQGLCFRVAGESATGPARGTSFVVSRTRKPSDRPTNRDSPERLIELVSSAHLFAFSPSVPRVRRGSSTSFRLATSSTTRPCDLPATRTRDVSDRRLPPIRIARTLCRVFPAFATATFVAWTPHGVWAPRGLTGGRGVSRRPHRFDRFAFLVFSRHEPRETPAASSSAGVFDPRRLVRPISDIPVASPLSSPSRLRATSYDRGAAETTVTARS